MSTGIFNFSAKISKKSEQPTYSALHGPQKDVQVKTHDALHLAQLHVLALGQAGQRTAVEAAQLGQLGVIAGVHEGAGLWQLQRTALLEHLTDELGAEIVPAALPADMHPAERKTDDVEPVKAAVGHHVLGTAATAVKLAEKYGADVHRAEVAGLLHDCTKKLNMEEQLELCGRYGIQLDELEQKALKLLHAKTGAAAAARIFGENNAVVSAIDYHTTGRAHMTLLEKIIYIADYMEPNRDFPGIDRLREAVWRDLDEGVLLGIDMTLEQLAQKGQPACADSLAARDWLIQTRKEP